MLVLGRKPGECVIINENIIVKVIRNKKGEFKIAIEAPAEVKIQRGELNEHLKRIKAEQVTAQKLQHD